MTHPSREPDSCHSTAADRNHSAEYPWYGRAQPEPLVQDSVEVGEVSQGSEGDVVGARELLAHFLYQHMQLIRVIDKAVERPAQYRSRGFAPRRRQGREVGVDLWDRQAAGNAIFPLDHVRHDVGALDLPAKSPLHPFRNLLIVVGHHLPIGRRDALNKDEVDPWVIAHYSHKYDHPDAVEDGDKPKGGSASFADNQTTRRMLGH